MLLRHHGHDGTVVASADTAAFKLLYGWLRTTTFEAAPVGMYSKDLSRTLRLANWLDADDADFVQSLTQEALWRAVAFAEKNAIWAFVDVAATRIVAELWGRDAASMVAWVGASPPASSSTPATPTRQRR